MSGRRRPPRPVARPCPLCSDLAQATVHFDSDWWESAKAAAEDRLIEARAEVIEAEKHLQMLADEAAKHLRMLAKPR